MTTPADLPGLTETQKTFDAMRNNLITVNTAVNILQEISKEQDVRVRKLEEVVVTGNGELALRERVRTLENFVDDIKDVMRYWGRLIGGALLLNFLGFTTGIIVALIKFLPVLERLAGAQP